MDWLRAHSKRLAVILEFIIFGVIVGVIEDLIAVKLATGQTITWQTVWIILLVTIPFAIIGELVVDNINFTDIIHRYLGKSPESTDKPR